MNLNAIKRCCMRAKKFVILNDAHGDQWLSNGQAAWIVEGVRISTGSIPELFNLTDKQMDKVFIDAREESDPRYHRDGEPYPEHYCEDIGAIWWNDYMYRALLWRGKLLFVLVENLKPTQGGEYSRFGACVHDGDLLVAVHNGLECEAILEPMPDIVAQRIQQAAADIAWQTLAELGKPCEAEKAAEALAEQMSI